MGYVRYLNPQKKDSQRIKKSDRSVVSLLHYSGIEFPVKLSQINKIEKQDQINVNVFGYERAVFPLQLSKEKYEKTMNLLYISWSKILIDSCSTKRNTKKKVVVLVLSTVFFIRRYS